MTGKVFLIGPMGAGKSTIGRHLAGLLNVEFLDSDQEIEKRTGASIPLIFDIEGEAGFRQRESTVIDELSQQKGRLVLATGGGAVLREENRHALRSRGTVVYLRAGLDILSARTRRDRNRPLLQTDDPRGKMEKLLREREPLYEQTADLIIDTARRSPMAVARELAAKIKSLWRHEDTDA